MGGSSYSRDVGHSSSSGRFSSGGTSSAGAKTAMGRSSMNSDLSPYNRIIKCERKSPIVVGLDVTGSNIEFARIVYDKAPMLHGQIEQQGYLTDFEICFSAIGDAYTDRAPLQVCDFKYGIELDKELKKLFLESGGGGQRKETYELGAYFFANNCQMPNAEDPFMFIIGDEAPYPTLRPGILEKIVGKEISESIDSKVVFRKLFKKFKNNVYFLQNPYCGDRRDRRNNEAIRNEWLEYIGAKHAEHIVPIHEEKSVVDVILGIIAMRSGTRDMDAYDKDMQDKGQTQLRRTNVKKSLDGLEGAITPSKGVRLPAKRSKSKKKGSGAKRL